MKNLEQIRARNALAFSKTGEIKGEEGGDIIKKIPALIMNHGLLATAAFSAAENKQGWQKVFDAIAAHLADPDIAILPSRCNNCRSMMEFLSEKASSEILKLATSESMAWLCYARRFVKKEKAAHES